VAAEKGMLIAAAELCPIELGERADYNRAGAKGLGLADVAGHPGAEEARALWAFVKQRLGLDARPSAAPDRPVPAQPTPKAASGKAKRTKGKAGTKRRDAGHAAA
jgi:hypothetical protein